MRIFFFLLLTFSFSVYSQEYTNTSYYMSEGMSHNGGNSIEVKVGISIDLDQNKIILHLDEPLRFTIESIEEIYDRSTQYNCIDPYGDDWIVNLKVVNKMTLITFWLDVNGYFTYSCKQIYDSE